MADVSEIALFVILYASLPTILSLTKGRAGTFTESLKNISTFGWAIVCTIIFVYIKHWIPIPSYFMTIAGCLVIGFIITFLPIHFFDEMWAKRAFEEKEHERDLAHKDEVIERLRKEDEELNTYVKETSYEKSR